MKWRDTNEELPPLKYPVILRAWSGKYTYCESLSSGDLNFIKENPSIWPHWMLIPELEGNEQ